MGRNENHCNRLVAGPTRAAAKARYLLAPLFLVLLVLLGIGGADFAVFSLWLPEVYPTGARAGGFAFVTTAGRLVGAGLTFAIGAMNDAIGLGKSLSLTAIFFVIGLLLLPLAREGRRALAPE